MPEIARTSPHCSRIFAQCSHCFSKKIYERLFGRTESVIEFSEKRAFPSIHETFNRLYGPSSKMLNNNRNSLPGCIIKSIRPPVYFIPFNMIAKQITVIIKFGNRHRLSPHNNESTSSPSKPAPHNCTHQKRCMITFPTDNSGPFPRRLQNRPRTRRSRQSESGQHKRFPRHGECSGRCRHLLHRRTIHRLEIRHSRAENRQQLQSVHAKIDLGMLEDEHGQCDAGADLDAGTVQELDRRGVRSVRRPGYLRLGGGRREGREGVHYRGERQRFDAFGRLAGGGSSLYRRFGRFADAGDL